MAMIVDALVSQFKDTLTTMAKDELTMLLGAKEALQQLKEEVRDFSDVLRDAEHRAFTETSVSNWLAVVKDFVYDADDIIDYSRTKAEKLARFPSGHPVRCYSILLSFFLKVALRHQMGSRIRTINERLHSIRKKGSDLQLIAAVAARDDRGSSSSRIQRDTGSRVEPDIVGTDIERHTTHLVGLLTRDHVDGPRIQVLAITGMGGVGKSTLGQKIFNHQAIKDNNFRPLIWVCVSKEYNQTKLMKEIIRSAGADPERLQSFAELQGLLAGVLNGKKFFLVLDDVWDAQVWEKLLQNPLQNGAPGSRVLITTRNKSVAKQIGATHIHTVDPLSREDSWSLFCKMVFRDGEEGVETVEDIGRQIVERCQGLPLAIKATAGVLRTKAKTRGEWEMVLKRQAWSSNKLPDEVMGVLYLSYEDLPHHLKQCFIFCSLFPEDHVFMRHTLIQHWVAEGFIKDEGDPIMEEVARDYYKELLTRSLLQPDPRYYDNGGCKMHDLLRSLAQFLSRDENFVGDLTRLVNPATSSSSSSSVKLRHLTIVDAELGKVSQVVKEYESLRTLLLIGNPFSFLMEDDDASEVPESVTDDLFKKLGCLRVLDLSYTNLITLSKSVGNLIHLRYLDLSFSSMLELPDSVEKLSNLQYLILQSCENLNKLPKGIAKLYKLRSLDLLNTQVDGLPAGIGRLKHLNRLMGFMTNEDMGGGWCSLEEIRSLSQLRTLTIDGIEKALIRPRPRGPLLNDKCHIYHLELCCRPNITDGQLVGEEDQPKILEIFEEELVPPPSVEKFEIKGFFGLQFPSWLMTSTAVFLLSNLRRLDLKKCMFCKQLPPLGQLPNLDLLNIKKAYSVEIIGPEFMGAGGRGPRMPQPIAFPKLETLKLEDMPNLMEWQWEAEDEVAAMPRLDDLKIIDCPSLRSLPTGLRSVTTLTTLIIEGAISLKVIENFVSLKVLVLSGNLSLVRVSNLPALENLVVDSCMVLSDVGGLNSLQRLQLQDFAMESLPDWLLPQGGKHAFPLLERMQILVRDARVLYRCLVDAPDWPKIQHFPLVQIQASSEPAFVLYNKATDTLTTNLNIGDGGGGSGGGGGSSATADHDT